jgi:outer membrane cobalamin receptor
MVPTVLEGEEVIVVAEKPVVEVDRTFSTSSVDRNEIDVMPVTQMSEIVEKQAGVVDGHFRGGRSGEVTYLLDGIPIQDSYDNTQSTNVNNSVVQELQVITGTFNAEYGQAMSGVVNMVTREGGDRISGSFGVEVGDYLSTHDDIFYNIDDLSPYNIQNYELTLNGPVPIVPKTGFFVNARWDDNEGWMYGQRRWELEHPVVLTDSGWTAFYEGGDNKTIPMNPDKNIYLYGKLSHQLSPKVKLSYSSIWSERDYRDYDHYYKYIPDADYKRFRDGRTNMLKLTHSLTNNAFYELGVSNTYTEYHHYVFEDPDDPDYVNPAYLEWNPAYTLEIGGTKQKQFRRYTNTYTFQGNLNWQITPIHLLTAGFKADFHSLYYHSFDVVDSENWFIEDPYTPFPIPFDPTVRDVSFIENDEYLYHPWEGAVYLQDKIELRNLIINAGLRVDYFNPVGKVLNDPKDPDIYHPILPDHVEDPLSERWDYWYKDTTPKTQLSPRLGAGYPISDNGVLHFAYGYFFQRPKFEYLYANPEFQLEPGTGLNTVMGNADLEVEKTVTYEFGLQQGLMEALSMDVTLFYRNIQNLVSTDTIIATYEAGTQYTQYINRDFGYVQGITLALDRKYADNFSASIDYTFQIAKANASDPQDAYNASKGDNEVIKQLVPMDWDRRHTLNANFNYIKPNNWGVSLLGTLGSGLPFTIDQEADELQFLLENSGRKPLYWNVDLSAFKDFAPWRNRHYKLRLTVLVKNLFDRLNENDVYGDTGRATYSQERLFAIESPEINTLDEFYTRPDYYSRPREVRVGLSFSF